MITFISYFGLAFQRIYPGKPNLSTDPKPLTKAMKMQSACAWEHPLADADIPARPTARRRCSSLVN